MPAFSKHHNMKMDGEGKVPLILNLESPAVISRAKSLVSAFRNLAEPDSHFDTVEKREVSALPGIYITMELFRTHALLISACVFYCKKSVKMSINSCRYSQILRPENLKKI